MNRDPRYRARLNQLSSTLESANLNTQASLFTFHESYLAPCLASVSNCLEGACYPCIGARRERARARQRRSAAVASRGRPEFVFDFYNDEWDVEGEEDTGERSGLLRGWGVDELDRLLAGSGADAEGLAGRQPRRKAGMSYGATAATGGARRKSAGLGQGPDPTILPGSSMFGFLERLPWRIGGRGVRYKPSAADLQENLGGDKRVYGRRKKAGVEQESGNEEETAALLEEISEDDDDIAYHSHRHNKKSHTHQRNRSDTTTSRSSRSTQNSLSSRGDLFPSEDEAADAVPLDDSFALSFAHRSSDGEAELDSKREDSEPDPDPNPEAQTRTRSGSAPTAAALPAVAAKSTSPHSSHRRSSRRSTPSRRKRSKPSSTQSEMVHSPVTSVTPTSTSTPTPSIGERVLRSASWSISSDAENEADVSALVSPVAERVDLVDTGANEDVDEEENEAEQSPATDESASREDER